MYQEPLFWSPMATKRKPMAKPRQKKAPVNQDDHVQKVQESQKKRTIRKRQRGRRSPGDIAKENQSDGEDRGQPELRYHRDVGHDDRDVRQDYPFARQSDPMAAVLGLPIHVLHAGE